LRKILLRYLVMLIGFLPILAVLLIYFGFYGSLDELNLLLLKLSRGDSFILDVGSRTAFEWHPTWGAYLFNLNLPGILPGDGSPSLDELQWLFDSADIRIAIWFYVCSLGRENFKIDQGGIQNRPVGMEIGQRPAVNENRGVTCSISTKSGLQNPGQFG